MKSIIQKSMVLALSTLLLSETLQAANVVRPQNPNAQNFPARQNPQVAPFTGSAKAAGVIKTRVKQTLAAYQNPAQPNFNALQQIMNDAQSIRPGVTNGYTQKEWGSLKVEVYNKTGVNLEADPAQMINAFRNLIQTLGLNGNVVNDQLAQNTVQGAQNFQAAWQAFLELGGNGSLYPRAQQQAAQLLGEKIEELRGINIRRGEGIEDLQNKLDACNGALNVLQQENQKCEEQLSELFTLMGGAKVSGNDIFTETMKKLKDTIHKNDTLVIPFQNDIFRLQQRFDELGIESLRGQNSSSEKALQQQLAQLRNELATETTRNQNSEQQLRAELDACLAQNPAGINQAMQKQNQQLTQVNQQLTERNTQLNQENTRLARENRQLNEAMEQTTKHMAQLTAALQAANEEIARLKQANPRQ
jgi:hypothetical protein